MVLTCLIIGEDVTERNSLKYAKIYVVLPIDNQKIANVRVIIISIISEDTAKENELKYG
jgi:hypothetical protein